jgi:membrane protein DedA with SNARE-associated domain
LGYSEISEVYLKKHFEKHKLKTFLLAKVSHGVGGTVQVIAGVARFDFKQFIILNLAGTIPKTLILMIIGFYLGNSYVKIDGYLNQMAIVTLSIFAIVIIYLLTNKHIRAHFKKD